MADGAARRVELVPVDAVVVRRRMVKHGAVARSAGDGVCVGRKLGTLSHAVVVRLTTDEVTVATVVIRRQIQSGIATARHKTFND